MFPPNICLNQFIQVVPHCLETATLAMALESCSQGRSDRLVLMNALHSPTGIVRLHRLLPYLVPSGTLPAAGNAAASPSEVNLCLRDIQPSVVEPLISVRDELPLIQFLPQLRSHPQGDYAITKLKGEFLGLLDLPHLISFLANHFPNWAEIAPPGLSQKETLSQDFSAWVMEHPQAEAHAWSVQRGPEPGTISHSNAAALQTIVQSAAIASPHLTPLQPLLDLLECLPLPLLLQTGDGKILAQNTAWNKQVGQLQNSDSLSQEAATLLNASQRTLTPPRSSVNRSTLDWLADRFEPVRIPSSAHYSPDDQALTYLYPNAEVPFQTAELSTTELKNHVCQLGPQADTCVCNGVLQDGQEQVVQFLKIAIGTFSADLEVDCANVIEGLGQKVDESSLQKFQLALLQAKAEKAVALMSNIVNDQQRSETKQTPEQLDAATSINRSETLWLILAQDVTEQQQLARELTAKNADLIQLKRLKDEFLACISHELRTPLTAVLGLSSLLKDQTLGELNQRQLHYAQLIYKSGRQLMAVVNDILDMARMEAGQLELTLEPVDIATVCNRAFEQAKQLRLLDGKQNVLSPEGTDGIDALPDFSLEIEPGLGLLVADEMRLRQMLIQLLSNALKFTEPGKQCGLKVNHWGGWVTFTVWDTGIGIPAEKQHLIFQKFQQLENPLTRRFEGTGLGLVLTQRLARLHGGDISFISKEEQGSQFTILLPPTPPGKTELSRADEDSPEAFLPHFPADRDATLPSRSPLKSEEEWASSSDDFQSTQRNRLVLIVEAVPQFIEELSEQLTGLGYRVVVARAGPEALEKSRRLQPCVIFVNPVLPLLSGWDVLTLLKSSEETRQIPVMMTATKVDEARAHNSQAKGLLSLPVQPKVLRQKLKQLWAELKGSPSLTDAAPATQLTVLRLILEAPVSHVAHLPTADLNQLLQVNHCRVLESDDLEQAELLARVWKPNAVLLDGTPKEPEKYFQQFRQHTCLAALPLVTLNQETTQAANQVPGLLVFPCLANLETQQPGDAETSALLQVLQIAAGYAWRPAILALDVAMLPLSADGADSAKESGQGLDNLLKETEWLKALTQYLQTAGFRSLIGRSWQEALQQVRSRSVDLLLICWTESELQPQTLEALRLLQDMETRPPIFVLDHRICSLAGNCPTALEVPEPIQTIVTKVLSPVSSMTELLAEIHQTLQQHSAFSSVPTRRV